MYILNLHVCIFYVFVLNPTDLISDGIVIEPVWLINPTAGGIYLPLLNPFYKCLCSLNAVITVHLS